MKINTGKYFTVLSLLALLVACAPMDPHTSVLDIETRHAVENSEGDIDHAALAKEYEDLAQEMQAKAQAQEEMLEHKPRSSYFGKNGQNVKSHIAFKIREYEQAAQESAEKAAYHSKIAAQMNKSQEQINKAKRKLDSNKDSL